MVATALYYLTWQDALVVKKAEGSSLPQSVFQSVRENSEAKRELLARDLYMTITVPKDGTWEGAAQGFGGDITVAVTVSQGMGTAMTFL